MAHRRPSKPATRDTYVRDLPYNVLRHLSRLLDPAGNLDWKALAERMPEYSSTEIGLFQMAYMRPGGSPTMDLLHDWGSRNRTVGNLVDLFKKMDHPVAANLVLPGSMPSVVNTLPVRERGSGHGRMSPSSHQRHDGNHAGRHPSNNSTLPHQQLRTPSNHTQRPHNHTQIPQNHTQRPHNQSTREAGHDAQPTLGPVPPTPPISSALFRPVQPVSYETVRAPVVNIMPQPVSTGVSFPPAASLQPAESLQPFVDTMSTPGGMQMKNRVIETNTRQPVQPQYRSNSQSASFSLAPERHQSGHSSQTGYFSLPVQPQASGTGQTSSFSRVPVAGGITCTENVEQRRKLLAAAAEKRMTETMESLVLTDGSMQSAGSSGSANSDASSVCLGDIEYETLCEVTQHFDDRPVHDGGKKLGQGSFGSVYHGEMRVGGWLYQVAVKRLLNETNDMDVDGQLKHQFQTELNSLTKYVHPNLVLLLGYSVDGPEFCLIYEYMRNGSLMDALTCKDGKEPLLSKTRLSIAVGCAQALAFLHTQEKPLVHRDVKSSNVLLDEHFIAKLSDFGIARALGVGDSTRIGTQKTTKVQGTNAYMSPEASRGTISVKMDAFALAIVFLELLTGLSPFDQTRESQDLKSHIEDKLEEEGNKQRLLDPKADWDERIALRLWALSDELSDDKKNKRKSVCDVLHQIEELQDL